MKKNSHIKSKFFIFLILLLFLFSLTNCQIDNQQKEKSGDTRNLTGHNLIAQLVKNNGYNSVDLDLTDGRIYDWVMSRLTKNDYTRSNSPQLYKEIDGLRDYQQSRRSAGLPVSESTTKAADESFLSIDHRIWNVKASITKSANPETATNAASKTITSRTLAEPIAFQVDTLSTVQNGADMILNSVTVYDEKGNEIADGQKSDYSGSPTVITTVTGNLVQKVPLEISSFSYIKPAGATRGSLKADFVAQALFPVSYNIKAPKDITGDGLIRVCLLRGYSDCDYDLRGQDIVKLPFEGIVKFDETVLELPVPQDLFIKISLSPITGGIANLQISRDQVLAFFKTDSVERTVSWNVPQVNGAFNGNLYNAFQRLHFQLSIHGPAITMDGITDIKCFLATNAPEDKDAKNNFYKMLPFEFAWSCLAKGTLITMGDGTEKKIEEIKLGDKVMSGSINNEGKIIKEALEVGDISTGNEKEAMILVKDSQGNSMLITSTHPVVLANNTLLSAGKLTAGASIMTHTGVAKIVSLDTLSYTDTVYNLKLNINPKQNVSMPEKSAGATMFANNFMVGDLVMQREHDFNLQKQAMQRQNLPKEWETDRLNYEKRSNKLVQAENQ